MGFLIRSAGSSERRLTFSNGLLDELFDSVGWELGTALDVLDGLLVGLFDSDGAGRFGWTVG